MPGRGDSPGERKKRGAFMRLNSNAHIRSRTEKPGKVDQSPNQAWPNLEMNTGSNPGSATYQLCDLKEVTETLRASVPYQQNGTSADTHSQDC